MSIAISTHPAATAQHAPDPPAEPGRRAGLDLPPSPESARAARRFAHATLAEWRLEPLTDDLDLVVSELITNALLHARTGRCAPGATIRLDLERHEGHLLCRVGDGSELPPLPEEAVDTAESGRGLLLVEAVSTCWGWSREAGGKSVWAQLRLP